jgi:hypothetical protein
LNFFKTEEWGTTVDIFTFQLYIHSPSSRNRIYMVFGALLQHSQVHTLIRQVNITKWFLNSEDSGKNFQERAICLLGLRLGITTCKDGARGKIKKRQKRPRRQNSWHCMSPRSNHSSVFQFFLTNKYALYFWLFGWLHK